MTTIPISWVLSIFAAVSAAVILSRSHLSLFARACFGLGLGAVVAVTAFVGLRLDYGFSGLSALQPHIAILIAPPLWLGFQSLTSATGRPPTTMLRSSAILMALCQLSLFAPMPWSTDVIVIATNVVCAVLLATMLRRPPDAFVQIAPGSAHVVRIALICATIFVGLITIADATIIVVALSMGNTVVMQFLTGASGVLVATVVLGMMIGIPFALGIRAPDKPSRPSQTVSMPEDRQLLDQLHMLMTESRLFTDPNLTLARLGRRMGCPARSISNAVNRETGENFSRFINGFRVRHAASLLKETDLPVTDVMFEAGFQSKSSFNSEFRRITGRTPSNYRKYPSDHERRVRDRDAARSET